MRTRRKLSEKAAKGKKKRIDTTLLDGYSYEEIDLAEKLTEVLEARVLSGYAIKLAKKFERNMDLVEDSYIKNISKFVFDVGYAVYTSNDLTRKTSGVINVREELRADYKSDKVICIWSGLSMEESRYVIAMLFGRHIFEGRCTDGNEYASVYNLEEIEKDREDVSAVFARNLLLPEDCFDCDYKKLVSRGGKNRVSELARGYKVPKEVVRARIVELGL